jgi:hypothetical protein
MKIKNTGGIDTVPRHSVFQKPIQFWVQIAQQRLASASYVVSFLYFTLEEDGDIHFITVLLGSHPSLKALIVLGDFSVDFQTGIGRTVVSVAFIRELEKR